jgi:hypothetical protein
MLTHGELIFVVAMSLVGAVSLGLIWLWRVRRAEPPRVMFAVQPSHGGSPEAATSLWQHVVSTLPRDVEDGGAPATAPLLTGERTVVFGGVHLELLIGDEAFVRTAKRASRWFSPPNAIVSILLADGVDRYSLEYAAGAGWALLGTV